MAEIHFLIKDNEDGGVEVERKVISLEPEDAVTSAKEISAAISHGLDNPHLLQNILSVKYAESQQVLMADGEEKEEDDGSV